MNRQERKETQRGCGFNAVHSQISKLEDTLKTEVTSIFEIQYFLLTRLTLVLFRENPDEPGSNTTLID